MNSKQYWGVAVIFIFLCLVLVGIYFRVYLPKNRITTVDEQKQWMAEYLEKTGGEQRKQELELSGQSEQEKKMQEIAEEEKYNLNNDLPKSEFEQPFTPCENENEVGTFKKPIQVTWVAKMDGCLAGCEGASFTRMPENNKYKYPYFSAYMKEGTIPEEFLKKDLTLKISGRWIGIDDGYSQTVFGNKCAPTIDIGKIEIIK